MDKEFTPNPQKPQAEKNNAGYHKNHKKKHYHNKKRNMPSPTQSADNEKSAVAQNDVSAAPAAEHPVNAQGNPNHHNNKRRHNRNRRNRNHNGAHAENNVNAVEKNDALISDDEKSIEASYDNACLERADEDSTVNADINTEVASKPAEEKEGELVEIIGIRFKVGGKTYYFSPNGIVGKKGVHAIVETARGLEFGEIVVTNSMVHESEFVPPLRPVVRLATEADIKHHDENKVKQDEAFKICNEKIIAHGLDMKLIDAQYTFDNSKLLFYFTSSGRVDFRELVKDLASVFKTRIELRQIGIRDEAKLIGGLGICGRPLCCSVFLSDFGQVSIKMAKEQNLSLNSSKISGACGRLMCCLRYEHETYTQEIKKTPPVDSRVKTPDGIGTVTEISPLAAKVKVRLDDKPDQAPRSFSRNDVTVIPKERQ